MDPKLRAVTETESRTSGLTVTDGFYRKLDDYVALHFRNRTEKEKLTIQTYLAWAGIQIAKVEKKTLVESEDAKAAIWLFHLPEHPDDPCAEAGTNALAQEAKRLKSTRGLLLEGFAKILDEHR